MLHVTQSNDCVSARGASLVYDSRFNARLILIKVKIIDETL